MTEFECGCVKCALPTCQREAEIDRLDAVKAVKHAFDQDPKRIERQIRTALGFRVTDRSTIDSST